LQGILVESVAGGQTAAPCHSGGSAGDRRNRRSSTPSDRSFSSTPSVRREPPLPC